MDSQRIDGATSRPAIRILSPRSYNNSGTQPQWLCRANREKHVSAQSFLGNVPEILLEEPCQRLLVKMSMQDYESARQLINDSEDADFDGEKPEELVLKAEAALGVKFPPTYRRFLLEFGCGDIGGEEIYGIIDENFESSSVPNGIWLTLDERKTGNLPPNYIIVYAGGDGSYCAIDTAQVREGNESPVVRLAVDKTLVEEVASNFGSFLNGIVSDMA